MIDSSKWTGLRPHRHSWAADLFRLTPQWLWRSAYYADAVRFIPFPSIILTAQAWFEADA